MTRREAGGQRRTRIPFISRFTLVADTLVRAQHNCGNRHIGGGIGRGRKKDEAAFDICRLRNRNRRTKGKKGMEGWSSRRVSCI